MGMQLGAHAIGNRLLPEVSQGAAGSFVPYIVLSLTIRSNYYPEPGQHYQFFLEPEQLQQVATEISRFLLDNPVAVEIPDAASVTTPEQGEY